MKRADVYKLIDGERDYQDKLPQHTLEQDKSWSVADWLIFIEENVDRAKKEVYDLRPDQALEHVRKVAALSVACMENNETAPR